LISSTSSQPRTLTNYRHNHYSWSSSNTTNQSSKTSHCTKQNS